MIANEGDETEYTDELKLLVVDHPAGVGAVADEQGRVHTLTHPCPPVKAADGRGYTFEYRIPWSTLDAKAPLTKGQLAVVAIFFIASTHRAVPLIFNGSDAGPMRTKSLFMTRTRLMPAPVAINVFSAAGE